MNINMLKAFYDNGFGYDILVAVVLVCQFFLLMVYFEPAISTPDANGYFVQTRLIVEQGRNWFVPESPLQFIDSHWLKTADGRYFCRYPPGLPLMLALPYKIGGPTAALLFIPILTSLTLLGLYLLTAHWIGKKWGLFATIIMVFNPIVITYALTQDAHAVTGCFLVWGLFMLARWSRNTPLFLAFCTGIVWGIIPTIRFAESIFLVAFCTFALMNVRLEKKNYQPLIAGCAGAAIPVLLLFVYNHNAFGAFWKTGYSLSQEQTAFSLSYFFNNALPYIRSFAMHGAGIMGIIGILGIPYLIKRGSSRLMGVVFALLVIPISLIYMSYYFRSVDKPQAMMRFLLPTFYVYAIAGTWLLHDLGKRRQTAVYIAGLILIIINAVWAWPQFMYPLRFFKYHNGELSKITRMVNRSVEEGSIIIAPHQIQQHLDFIGKWRLADLALFQPRAAGTHDIHDFPQMHERQKVLDRYRETDPDQQGARLMAELKQWAGPDKEIHWIGAEPPGDEWK